MAPMLSKAVRRGIEEGLFEEPPHAILFYDLDQVRRRIDELRAAFPPSALHAVAIKACPVTRLLRRAAGMGCGAEAASAAEVEQALRVGIPPEHIVFDSPAKTIGELRAALARRIHINADSLQEVERIARLVEAGAAPTSIGVRVNPEIRPGTIRATSTAMPGSKFGVSLADNERELLACFERHAWLTGLHVHAGSQGCDLDLLTQAVARTVELAGTIAERCGTRRISTFDIGGGLPVTCRFGERRPGFGAYAAALRQRVPALFSSRWRIVTEFGRAVWANAGFAVSRVEYTKTAHGRHVAVAHLGADMFTRTAYVPDEWYHEVSVHDHRGCVKSADPVEQDIGGPLCFSGDLIATGRLLPRIEPGDYVLVHDAGAYTLSMWSRYNSRLSPAVYGVERDHEALVPLRRAEGTSDVLGFWD